MRLFLKKGIAVIMLLLTGSSLIAQEKQSASSAEHSKFFLSRGTVYFTGLHQAPITTVLTQNINTGLGPLEYVGYNTLTWDIVGLEYRFRYNMYEMNDNGSVSLSFIPALGLGSTEVKPNTEGFTDFDASLTLPAFIEYNSGNVSTYRANKDAGFVLGVGAEYVLAPIFPFTETGYNTNGASYSVQLKSSWTEIAFELGYRYWGRSNIAREINLKVGAGAGGTFSARLAFMKYIGY